MRTGEMTPTLHDVTMILELSIEGEPLCVNTDSSGWRQQIEALIGRAPIEIEDKSEDIVPTGATYTWILQIRPLPAEADEDTIKIVYSSIHVVCHR
jgi:hypothetical protein